MTDLGQCAEQFRSAVEARDFTLAQTALQEYVDHFRSRSRTLPEIEEAKRLFEWGITATKTEKAQMVEDLMLLKRVFDAYGPPRRFHTWRLEG